MANYAQMDKARLVEFGANDERFGFRRDGIPFETPAVVPLAGPDDRDPADALAVFHQDDIEDDLFPRPVGEGVLFGVSRKEISAGFERKGGGEEKEREDECRVSFHGGELLMRMFPVNRLQTGRRRSFRRLGPE